MPIFRGKTGPRISNVKRNVPVPLFFVLTGTITSTLTVAHLEGPQDLAKVRVGTLAGTTGETYLQFHQISYTAYKTAGQGLGAIREGSMDALVYDAPILRYLIHHEFQGNLEVLPHTFCGEDYGIALPKSSTLRKPINRILLEKIHGREWQYVLHRYLCGSFDLNSSRLPQ